MAALLQAGSTDIGHASSQGHLMSAVGAGVDRSAPTMPSSGVRSDASVPSDLDASAVYGDGFAWRHEGRDTAGREHPGQVSVMVTCCTTSPIMRSKVAGMRSVVKV